MGIKTPFICEIAPDTFAINEFGLAAVYLLVGRTEALLIDTGCGVCDLKGVIGSLTDKPYRVVISHGHQDHIGGMACFDKVYLNQNDHEMAKSVDNEVRRSFAEAFGKAGGYEVFEYSPETIEDITQFPEFLPLNDGDMFDLGGRVIQAIAIPGHTNGGMSFLDEKNRIIFSGDCCNVNLLATDCSVESTLNALRKFQSYSDRFDQNFNGHVGYLGSASCFSQPKTVTDDLIEICERILRNEGEPEPFDFVGHSFFRMSFGAAKLSYDPDFLLEAEEKNGKQ